MVPKRRFRLAVEETTLACRRKKKNSTSEATKETTVEILSYKFGAQNYVRHSFVPGTIKAMGRNLRFFWNCRCLVCALRYPKRSLNSIMAEISNFVPFWHLPGWPSRKKTGNLIQLEKPEKSRKIISAPCIGLFQI